MPSINNFPMSKEIDRVPSSVVPLNTEEQVRFEGLAEEACMIDVHQHPFVLPEAMDRLIAVSYTHLTLPTILLV